MIKPIHEPTLATIQRALDLYEQGKGPKVLGSFRGKGSTRLVALRQGSGKYMEGRYPACREDQWHEVTVFYYEIDD